MVSHGHGGRIIFIASLSGHRVNYPQPQVAYNTSKAALIHMARSLAAEWTQHAIRVNTISPGYMDTVLNEADALEPFRQVWADRNPMRRMGSPQEITGPVVLLCSEIGGSYINGADLVVDGMLDLSISSFEYIYIRGTQRMEYMLTGLGLGGMMVF
jgi:NAD(P)-dependent dehydrogenase (short-subunit alcohol dehydrogenase family)